MFCHPVCDCLQFLGVVELIHKLPIVAQSGGRLHKAIRGTSQLHDVSESFLNVTCFKFDFVLYIQIASYIDKSLMTMHSNLRMWQSNLYIQTISPIPDNWGVYYCYVWLWLVAAVGSWNNRDPPWLVNFTVCSGFVVSAEWRDTTVWLGR